MSTISVTTLILVNKEERQLWCISRLGHFAILARETPYLREANLRDRKTAHKIPAPNSSFRVKSRDLQHQSEQRNDVSDDVPPG